MDAVQTAQRLLRSYLKMFPHCHQLTEVVDLRQKIKEQLSKRKRQSPSKRSREVNTTSPALFETHGSIRTTWMRRQNVMMSR